MGYALEDAQLQWRTFASVEELVAILQRSSFIEANEKGDLIFNHWQFGETQFSQRELQRFVKFYRGVRKVHANKEELAKEAELLEACGFTFQDNPATSSAELLGVGESMRKT